MESDELHENCQRYREFFEFAPEACFVTCPQGSIIDANRAASQMLNVPLDQLIGRPLAQFVDRSSSNALADALVLLREDDHVTDWMVRMQPVGREPVDVWLMGTPSRDASGAVKSARWMARDVSRRVRAEEQVRRLNADLEQRVAQRTAELEAASRAKDQFLSMLSHELRTPLTPVLAAVTALANDPRVPDDLRAILTTVRRNVELEARLVDDLLDLTRLTRGELDLQWEQIDVHEGIRQVAEICQSEVRFAQLDLILELHASHHIVRGDAARLQQVWWALVKNAIKFTPPLGEITIRTENDEAGRLLVSVIDTGAGIEPEAMEKLFVAFEQTNAAAGRHPGGLGLGLAISRALVSSHGGTISAHSDGRGRGATFIVSLPALPVDEPEDENRNGGLVRGLRILLVEDHEDTALLMGRLLQGAGHRVRIAMRVEEALLLSQTEAFDLIISDLGLPDGTGLDLVRQVRASRDMRAIALSGFGMEEDIRRSREAGFDAHLTKPVNFNRLLSMIDQVAR